MDEDVTVNEAEQLLYSAKLSEQAERYDEMAEHMNKLSKMGKDLSAEERNLLSVAYKNAIGVRRASWRILSSLESRTNPNDSRKDEATLKSYKGKVEDELSNYCNDILSLLTDYLIPSVSSESHESRIFYHKMAGDYYRYLSEFKEGEARKKGAEESLKFYKSASDLANNKLPASDPLRLGLALNFSVFYYEILNSPERACRLAKATFDDAMVEVEHLKEETYKDSTVVLQLLHDNLSLWTSDMTPPEKDTKEANLQDVDSNDGN